MSYIPSLSSLVSRGLSFLLSYALEKLFVDACSTILVEGGFGSWCGGVHLLSLHVEAEGVYLCELRVSLVYIGFHKRRRIWGFCHQLWFHKCPSSFSGFLFFPISRPLIYQSSFLKTNTSNNPVFASSEKSFWGLERWLWLALSCCVLGLVVPVHVPSHS